ncbi:GNAT family N-acetyltransferase [Nonomuraea angiospora]|jgi:GNAT superfamily N-acetyltransferase|uniref:GNAT superfamily N-acetyltransferase n=1 Tax=Nonomuraea angiospora TaxID=46172 RepID=A0ABR9LZ06_9ACTN|nr:GNAT family N-acetyltransferase [Nonomuraea angiospora]MBE1585582.1 GNAT superfamily N-acetyltransferase [Nonomuraea angiospora]MDX3110250.1 GNAT family N-acetyltransferase [Nonomuraea angiospora]
MTADDLLIRRAEKADADEVFALAREFGLTFRPERGAFDAALPELLANEDALLLAAVVGGRVQGYLLGFVHLTLFANGPVAWVEEAMVGSGARRQGIGRALLEEFERWARSREAGYVAMATRRAPEFYHALGYEASATFFRKVLR